MANLMNEEIAKIRRDIPALQNLADEKIFNLVCYKYFYNNGVFTYSDFKNIFTDGKDDGGIDFITTYEPDDIQTNLVFAQCKYHENSKSKRDYIPDFAKMNITITDFKTNNNISAYNTNLSRIMANNLDSAKEEGWNEELAYFIYADIDEKRQQVIQSELEKAKTNSTDLRDYEIILYSKIDIDKQIECLTREKTSVSYDKIKLYCDNGKISAIIKYKDKGLLTSISAKSLKDLYLKYRYDGLFEQNLRYFKINKKIDDKIINSINKKSENFWYFNNGIIIACSDFEPDGDNIKLWDFSIVNGGQTTVLIGDHFNGLNDIAIPCKIIKDENIEFLAQVAEASNSQKAISDVDLKANAPEQKQLKKLLEKVKIFLEIKKGKVGNIRAKNINEPIGYNKDTWDKISNEELGQLLLSFVKQKPGTARSGKKTIFSVEKTYNSLFKPKEPIDPYFVKSLIKLYNMLKQYENNSGMEYGADSDENAILRYGKFFIIAIIGFLYKEAKGLINFDAYSENDDKWEQELERTNLEGSIFKETLPDNYEEVLQSLFYKIIKLIKDAHRQEQNDTRITSTYTNFFKTNKKYRDYMLKELLDSILKVPLENKDLKEKYLKVIFNI